MKYDALASIIGEDGDRYTISCMSWDTPVLIRWKAADFYGVRMSRVIRLTTLDGKKIELEEV